MLCCCYNLLWYSGKLTSLLNFTCLILEFVLFSFVLLNVQSSKLKKSTEHIHLLEEKLQIALNENAKLKVKLKEDEKLWEGLESKLFSTKTFCDQLMETLQQLASQVQDGGYFKHLKCHDQTSSIDFDNLLFAIIFSVIFGETLL